MSENKLTREGLQAKKNMLDSEVSDIKAENIESRQPEADAKAHKELDRRNIQGAVKDLGGVVEMKQYALIQLSTGDFILEELAHDRNDPVNVQKIYAQEHPLNKYNKDHIISISIFGSRDSAMRTKEALTSVKVERENAKHKELIDALNTVSKALAK